MRCCHVTASLCWWVLLIRHQVVTHLGLQFHAYTMPQPNRFLDRLGTTCSFTTLDWPKLLGDSLVSRDQGKMASTGWSICSVWPWCWSFWGRLGCHCSLFTAQMWCGTYWDWLVTSRGSFQTCRADQPPNWPHLEGCLRSESVNRAMPGCIWASETSPLWESFASHS